MRLEERASLRAYNTFGVDARARLLVHLHDLDDVQEFAREPRFARLRCLVLGAGSNLLLRGDFDGVVARVALRGIEQPPGDRESVHLRVAAGEDWHGLVQHTLRQGHAGLENLSLIPGTAGAAPIQNIGAYGVELSRILHSVEAVERSGGARVTLSNADCRFAYRDSVFKHAARERYIITAINLRLPRAARYETGYRGVTEELERMGVTTPDAASISRAVCAIRRRKLPDPARLGNAGSFFKNPVLSDADFAALRRRYATLPGFPQAGGGYKLSAAWLIEQCGWKGHREGDAGVYRDHALVLVNHGAASGVELWRLACAIRDSVQRRFGVRLHTEPRVV